MKPNRVSTVIGVLIISIIIFYANVAFPIVAYTTLHEKLQHTDVVAVGTIVNKEITSNITYNYFKTSYIIYGNLPKPIISIITLGGKGMWVEDQANYNIGEVYLVFLKKKDKFRYKVRKGSHYHTVFYKPSLAKVEFNTAIEAIEPLLEIKNESNYKKHIQKLVKMLKEENCYLLESAITEIKNEKVQKAIPDLIYLLKTGGYQTRFNSIESLRNIGGANAVSGLIAALHDSSSGIRERAAKSLGWMKACEVENELIDLLCNKKEQIDVRICAVVALGDIHSTKSLSYLEKVWNEEKEAFATYKDMYLLSLDKIRTSGEKSHKE